MHVTRDWIQKMAEKEGNGEIAAGVPDYVPPFIPSAADRYYNRVIAMYQTRIDELNAERDLLRQAVVRYCDRSRMGTVEPPELQRAIDDAFELSR